MKALTNIENLDLPTFLERNRISQDDFTKSNIDWDLLKSIGLDHASLFNARQETAEFFAKIIQGCNKVHSVRWRVKNPEHLMEKIVRKRIPETKSYNEEYLHVNVENYHETVTDLVGIRALHLFKDDYLEIDEYLGKRWNQISNEHPIYYFREGDDTAKVPDRFDKKQHPAGYRSIHYIFESQPLNKKLFTEVQVRTIFEEGWSEIDHVVRYPNFSDNQNISGFLDIFNRLAGSADEMGSFAKQLAKELQDNADKLEETETILKSNETKIEELLNKLTLLDNNNTEKELLISELKQAIQEQKDIAPKMDTSNFVWVKPSTRPIVARTTRTNFISSSDLLPPKPDKKPKK